MAAFYTFKCRCRSKEDFYMAQDEEHAEYMMRQIPDCGNRHLILRLYALAQDLELEP